MANDNANNYAVTAEGWSPAHDDAYKETELARAGAAYAISAVDADALGDSDDLVDILPRLWPWPQDWWKPTNRRRDLVKAGALILAEIERIDRVAARGAGNAGEGA